MYQLLPSVTIQAFPPITFEEEQCFLKQRFTSIVKSCFSELHQTLKKFMQDEWEFSVNEKPVSTPLNELLSSKYFIIEETDKIFHELKISQSLKKDRGLPNLGYSCYFNSVIQVFETLLPKNLSLSQIVDIFKTLPQNDKNLFKVTFLLLIYTIRYGTEEVLYRALKNHFDFCFMIEKHLEFNRKNYKKQKDAMSYLELWHEMMENSFLVESYVTAEYNSEILKSEPIQETATFIYVDMQESKRVLESLKKDVNLKELIFLEFDFPHSNEDENAFRFNNCALANYKRQKRVVIPPRHLTVHLARGTSHGKISTPLELGFDPNETIDLSSLCLQNKSTRYRLVGAVKHFGKTEHAGHYQAAVRKDQWKIFDDANVTRLESSNFLQEAYIYFFKRIN